MFYKKYIRTFVLLLSCLIIPLAHSNSWKTIALGVEYQDLESKIFSPWSHIHVFRIDPQFNQFNLVTSQAVGRKQTFVENIAHRTHALITINGGFFDEQMQPIGLRINQNKVLSPLKNISWWGIFYIENNQPHIASYAQYQSRSQKPQFAIQCGPRLLVRGQPPALKPGLAERSALGITRDNHIIILVTEHNPMTTLELADLLRSSTLNCKDALNLDGGGSSQLYAKLGSFEIDSHGYSEISDAIIVQAKRNQPQA